MRLPGCVGYSLRGLLLLCLFAGAIWAALLEYQLLKLDRDLTRLRSARVGMHEDDVRRGRGDPAAVLYSSDELTRPPYSDYEQSARPFPDHLVVYFLDREMLQLHCDAQGRIECVFWGPRR